jgi:TnpA family transposase
VSDWEKRYLGWEHFPVGLDAAEIAVFFALGEADLAAIEGHRRDTNRLAVAIQIGYMRMTGVALNSVQMIPPAVLACVAGQLGQTPPQLTSIRALYRRRRTLHDHQEVARLVLGLRVLGEHGRRKLKAHLRKIVPVQVVQRDLVREARRWLDHNHCLQLGERTLLDLAREVRRDFETGVRERLSQIIGDMPATRWVDALRAEASPGVSRLEWLRTGPKSKRPKGLADHVGKLRFLKEMGADRLDLGLTEPALRALAMPLRHRKAAALRPGTDQLALACFLRLRRHELGDHGVDIVLHRTTDLWRQARQHAEDRQAGLWRSLRQLPQDLALLAGDASIADSRFRAAALELVAPFVAQEAVTATTRVALIRQELAGQGLAVSTLLAALTEIGVDVSASAALTLALSTLERIDGENARMLSHGTINPFGATWQKLIGQADRQQALSAYKAATLLLLKRTLRNGQAHCPVGLRYRAIEDQLIPHATWRRDKGVLIRALGLPGGPERALAGLRARLGSGLALLAQAVEAGDVRVEEGHFIIPKIKPDVEDPATAVIRRRIFSRIGPTQLADILVETDSVTRFSHAALGRAPRGDAELIAFYAALLALGSDLSAADMARMVPGLAADTVAAMIRRLEHSLDHGLDNGKSGLRAANAAVLGHFRRLPVAKLWGDGVTASSDMMSIETSRKLWAARLDPRRQTASVGTYTHILDQWAIAWDQPVLLGTRQAGAAIEGALRHSSTGAVQHRGIERLAVDTHGYTHFAAGIGKALGIDLCVRPSGLADRKLYLPRGFAVPDALIPITRCSVAPGTIVRGYDEFLRVAASLKHGWCSASWLIERFGSAAKGNPVYETGAAIGALARTIHLCDYLANEAYRRTINALLAQGEAVHTLQRAIHDGPITAAHGRSSEELIAISGALTLIANLVIFWNARQIDAILAEAPEQFDQAHLARIAPIAHAHINMRGTLRFDLQLHRDALLDHSSKSTLKAQNRTQS